MTEPQVGVALTKCFWCNRDDKVILNTRLTKSMREKVEAMHGKVVDYEPCPQCRRYMEQHVILITIDESKSDDLKNPYRTGGWFVVSEEFIRKAFPPEFAEQLLEKRVGWIEHQAAEMLGLFDAQEQGLVTFGTEEDFNRAHV